MCLILCVLVTEQAFLSSADFFQNQLFQKILLGIASECQTVWILIRPEILSGLIWVRTVSKGYQQTKVSSLNWRLLSILQAPITAVEDEKKMSVVLNQNLKMSSANLRSCFRG